MPANTPFAVVQNGPRFTPLRYGLLSAAQIIDDTDPHWQAGTMFQPDATNEGRSITAYCVAGGPATGTPSKDPTITGAPMSAAEPFTVYAYTNCAPVGWDNDLTPYKDRAARQLDAGEGRVVERVFWTGQPDKGPVVHPHLAEDTAVFANPHGPVTVELQEAADVISGTAFTIKDAFAAVEGALSACYGGEGVIHVPAQAVPYLEGFVKREGSQLRTTLGHIVAAYAANRHEGPTGAAAAAGSAWIYGTGAVVARRSPMKPTGQVPGDFVDKSINGTVYVVERTYVVDWDACLVAARGGYNTGVSSP